jgi:hypothetical protein
VTPSKRKIKKDLKTNKLCSNEVGWFFANSQNLHILLLWNQKSQEADIQDYELS